MPAKDRYHNTVVHALENGGWHVSERKFLMLDDRRLWIDMQAERNGERIIVEVKGFENLSSPVEYLASVAGQYLIYLAALEYLEIDLPLYLAVPEDAYYGILSETIGQQVRRKASIQLLVFHPEREEVIEWEL